MSILSQSRQPSGESTRSDIIQFPGQDQDGLHLSTVLGILRRRLWLVLGIIVLVTSLVALYVNQLTPLYYAEATLVAVPVRSTIRSCAA